MDIKLLIQAVLKIILGILLVGALIFVPAGTLKFFNGWLLVAVLFLPMLCVGTIMLFTKPELLEKRLDAKEQHTEQKMVVKLSIIMFIVGFITAGIDFKLSLSSVSKTVVVIAVLIFLLAYLFYGEVIRENAYLSRTIRVQENQKVVDTGLYAIVRHPMYTASIFLFLSMPLILGSFWAFLIFLVYPFIIAWRIKSEETFLEKELVGYTEYKQKVKYRLIPFIW